MDFQLRDNLYSLAVEETSLNKLIKKLGALCVCVCLYLSTFCRFTSKEGVSYTFKEIVTTVTECKERCRHGRNLHEHVAIFEFVSLRQLSSTRPSARS